MIDIHCHILPGLDDGAADSDVAEQMLAAAAADGIDTIVCTPHSSPAAHSAIEQKIGELSSAAARHGIRLVRGMEYRYAHLHEWKREELLTLGESTYLLVELAVSSLPPSAAELFFSLMSKDFHVILAHPERNLEDLEECAELERTGVFFQLNCDSVLGRNGKACRRMAFKMIDRGFCHYIASDAHGRSRTFRLSECRKALAEVYGEDYAEMLLERNPRRMLEKRNPERRIPKRKGGFFRRLFGGY